MKKTKESIQRKYNDLFNEVVYRCKCKSEKKAEELRQKEIDNFCRQFQKYQRKIDSYIKKKKQEYDRKCDNEIRKLEGKKEKHYKKRVTPFKTLEFAMELQQENSKLRDTDRDGNGFCISCNTLCSRQNLHGGHYHSRRVKNICVHEYNINAQCRKCNLITGPLGNVEMKEMIQNQYRANLIEKCGKETVELLDSKKVAYFQKGYETNGDYGQGELPLEDWIAQAICENEMRWRNKSFYKPKKKWRKLWEERNS